MDSGLVSDYPETCCRNGKTVISMHLVSVEGTRHWNDPQEDVDWDLDDTQWPPCKGFCNVFCFSSSQPSTWAVIWISAIVFHGVPPSTMYPSLFQLFLVLVTLNSRILTLTVTQALICLVSPSVTLIWYLVVSGYPVIRSQSYFSLICPSYQPPVQLIS
jgi:hypothetical protein